MDTGTYEFGPDNATLRVLTGRAGAAARAGHDLVIEVAEWNATLEIGEPSRLEVDADGGSLRIREGTGGIQALTDDDRAEIEKTIDAEVLRRAAIRFRSTSVEDGGDALRVAGDLDLAGHSRPVSFELARDGEDRISGSVTVKQSDWGIKPYSALFGALKVADEVRVAVETEPPAGD